MEKRFISLTWMVGAIIFTALLFIMAFPLQSMASENIKLIIDQEQVEITPAPIIDNGRTLVPIRLISEKLGAIVNWDQDNRTIHIQKGERSVLLRLDNRLIDFREVTSIYSLADVAPKLIGDRTFVPLRLVSNALGVSIDWDGNSRTIYINSKESVDFSPFFDITLPSVKPGQNITGLTHLQLHSVSGLPSNTAQVSFQLLDPNTGQGPVIARGINANGVYPWLPDPAYSGLRLLAAGLYDQEGRFLAGTVTPVQITVNPQVTLTGIAEAQQVSGTLSIGVNANFLAEYVKYEITHLDTGKVIVSEEMDPQGAYSWTPQLADNGNMAFRALAYDRLGQVYTSSQINIKSLVERKLELRGIAAGTVVEKPVTLWLSRNFPVTQVEYLMKNVSTGEERMLARFNGYSSYGWFPGPEQAGTWEVLARVYDTVGNSYTSNPIVIQVTGAPKLLLEAVAPNQVVTETLKLKSKANVPLSSIEYRMLTTDNKFKSRLAGGSDGGAEYTWTPEKKDVGFGKIQAVGVTISGEQVISDAVPIRVYLGTIHKATPIIVKDKFLEFASNLALNSQGTTGMSAALQTAQAILETGWGQQTPVDKYTGQRSYNLFGIKGKGPAGSVTSNTWEEYNGNAFRVDAQFRAYQKPEESWLDHKRLLLTSNRYEPYRAVMHNSTQGAWALKRTGYATDSKYPLKLIDIIKRYNLHQLDEKGI